MKLTKKVEKEILGLYQAYWDAYLDGDMKKFASFLDPDISVFGTAVSEVFTNKKEAVRFYKATADQMVGKAQFRNRHTRLQQVENTVVVNDENDLYVLTGKKWSFYGHARVTALFKQTAEGWKLAHQHASFPDVRADEGEQIAAEKIKQENLELKKAVKRRTLELEQKNRELEIETALERVRTVAMSMKEPAAMLEVCKTISEQLALLDLKDIRNVQTAIFNEAKGTYINYEYYARHEKLLTTEVDYNLHTEHAAFANKMLKGAGGFYEQTFKGKKLKDWYQYQRSTNQFADSFLEKADSLNYYMYSLGAVVLGISTYKPLKQEEIILFKRFLKVFELAYRRYLDIEKANGQTREAEVQLALERVRARAMAMHKSEEIQDVGNEVFKRLKELGVGLDTANILIFDKNSEDIEVWTASDQTSSYRSRFLIPLSSAPHFSLALEAMNSGGEIVTYSYDLAAKNKWFNFLFDQTDYKHIPQERKQYILDSPLFTVSVGISKNIAIQLNSYTRDVFNDEENNILKRFTAVFEQSYTRFLDLQKAEEQARESQIQLALERVRARTMAMQKSEELTDVAGLLFRQVSELGIKTWTTGFNVWSDDNVYYEDYITGPDGGFIQPYTIDTTKYSVFGEIADARKNGADFFVQYVDGERLMNTYKWLSQFADQGQFEKMLESGFAFPTHQFDHFVFGSKVSLMFITYEPVPKAHDIFKRFGKVFEQTYTRFLDLQKAEEQAREAKIEAALEKVRSRSLAMHKSDELQEVVNTVFEKLQELNIEMDSANIAVFKKGTRDFDYWIASPVQKRSASFHMPYIDLSLTKDIVAARESGAEFSAQVYPFETKNEWFEFAFKHTDFKFLVEERKDFIFKAPAVTVSIAFSKNTGIQVNRYSTKQLNDGEIEVLKRFSRVFEQAYIRFLDLEKAENQAREAQIEASLERVRARAMAMHKSEDLAAAVTTIFEEFDKLNAAPQRCGIGIIDKSKCSVRVWSTVREEKGIVAQISGDESMDTHPLLRGAFNAWLHQADFSYVLEGNDLSDYYATQRSDHFRLPESQLILSPSSVQRQYYHLATFQAGGLFAFSDTEFTDETRQVMTRFANVFDLTYKRFLDLQKAESQAREAQIELGLERVRAKAMAMQRSEELKELIGTVFTELTKLDIILTRCLIMIYDAKTKGSTWWMANSEAPSDPIGLPVQYHEHAPYLAYVSAWQERKLRFQYILEGKDKNDWDDFLFSETALSQLPPFVIAGMKAPGRVYLNASFNSFGNLTLATLETLSEEHFDIMLRFAKVFDLTYTRFNDLKQAEAQAREAQIQLSLERVRARAMAMHRSDELKELIHTVSTELGKLDIMLDRSFIIIYDIQTLGSTWWMSHPETPSEPVGLYVKYHEAPPYLAHLQAWKDKLLKWEYLLEGDVKKSWDEFLFVETELSQLPAPVIERMRSREKIFLSSSFNNFGYLTLASVEPLTEEQSDIMLRFAKVFDLTYTRFNDLKQAEAQAKEAKIEAALERVRSRTMAMHKSEELAETAQVLFHQLLSLGSLPDRMSIGITDEARAVVNFWTTDQLGSHIDNSFTARLNEPTVIAKQYRGWKEGQKSMIIDLQGDELVQWTRFAREEMGIVVDDSQFRNRRIHHSAFFSHGWVLVSSHEPQSAETIQLLERFASVFNLTYTRFLDLQKAEAQAREAQIEASLERVRSKTMAMHNSQDVGETVATMLDELVKLGIQTLRCGVGIMHEGYQMELWTAIPRETGKTELVVGNLDMKLHPLLTGGYDSWKNKQEHFSFELTGEDLYNYFVSINNYPGYPVKYDIASLPSRIFHNEFHFNEGTLFVFSVDQLTLQTSQVFKRFAGLFGQTYRRYLDLKQAEANAREAQIETGLERVRARTMAMHNSEDVSIATATMLNELEKLGIQNFRGGILNIREDQTMEVWSIHTLEDGSIVRAIGDFDMREHPFWQGLYIGWKNKDDSFHFDMSGKDKEDYVKILDARRDYLPHGLPHFPDCHVESYFFGEGAVWCFSLQSHSEEHKQLMKRFASVFSLTFRRYKDLQKAEAQAREAQIEAGLERVRYNAMAMQTSNDVGVATAAVFHEISILGVETMRCCITIIHHDDTADVWAATTTAEGKEMKGVGSIQLSRHPAWQGMYKGWVENKEDFSYELKGENLKSYYRALINMSTYSAPYLKEEDFPPDHHFYASYFEQGAIFTFSLIPHNEEKRKIIRRFTNVFSLTFRRYLDLAQAEAQAKEAKIEAALERVRGKAMAMHSSKDLAETIGIFYRELETFSITPRRCGVGLLNKATRIAELSTMNTTEQGSSVEIIGTIKMEGHPVLEGVYDHWLLQKEYHPVLRGNDIKEYYSLLRPQIAFPDYPNDAVQYGYFFFFNEGGVYAWTEKEMSEDELQIYRRFTTVLNLTYKRYIDLKQAEANAKEAVKQAALDRIRADIASMRKIGDLERITPLIWNELTILGISFIRCGVFIMDNSQQLIHTFLSTPDGKAIAAFHLPYDTPGNLSSVLSHWKNHENYIAHWDESAFTDLADILVKQGAIASPGQYLGTIPRGGFYLHFLPFLQGMLYVGNTSRLDEEAIQLIQSVADAFSTAYARYEDFNKLEAAKQQVEKTLTDLEQAQTQLVQAEKMASLGELTAGIAHEIQNPLNFVNNFSDVSNELLHEMKHELEKGNNDDAMAIAEDVRQNLEKILHHGRRADAIVKGMLQHSRTSSGQKELTDINALADEYVRLAFHGLRAKDKSFNAKFETHLDHSIEKINIIAQDIGRVILNLINNSFYAVNEKKKRASAGSAGSASSAGSAANGYEPTVTISTKKLNDRVEIKVEDNGIGVSQTIVDKIFQPFFTTKPAGQGTGLGLSLTYDIVKAHNGDISVSTKENEGTTVTVQLPAS